MSAYNEPSDKLNEVERDLLYHSPFFEPFAGEDLAYLEHHARIETYEAGETLISEGDPARALMMLLSGKVRLSFRELSEDPTEEQTRQVGSVVLRDVEDAGYPIGWSVMVRPFRYHASADALQKTRVMVFDREVLGRRAEERPEFGVTLMERALWVVGRRLRETRIRLVARRYKEEVTAIRALLDQSAERLHVDSPLHRIPFYLEHRLTLSDAFNTLELLRAHGDELERDLAGLCLQILDKVRRELDIFQHAQNIYELATGAVGDVSPRRANELTCREFIRLFSRTSHRIVGAERLPEEPGHIFVLNHICSSADYVLPNGYRLSFDTNFVGAMLVFEKYGLAPVRVVRKSYADEYGHKNYYDRLNFLYVKAKIPDRAGRRRARAEFFEQAREVLLAGDNIIICPEGACTETHKSPLPMKVGAFRLAARVEPEPKIVPVAVANFDKKLTDTVLVAAVHEPFRVSDRISGPVTDEKLFAFAEEFSEEYKGYVREAVELGNLGSTVKSA